jgi:hypothetical protein
VIGSTAEFRTTATGDFLPGDDYFAEPRDAFGGEAIAMAVGPLRFRLEGLSALQAERLRGRFAPFVEAGEGSADLAIALCRAGVASFLRPPTGTEPETYRLGSRAERGRLTLWSYEFAGWVEPAARRAMLAVVEEDGPLFDRGLENFLRIMTASFVLEHGGFLFHASGVVRGGRAYVFFGPSGAGKTTVTHLSKPKGAPGEDRGGDGDQGGDTVLSDDLTLVVRRGGRYEACGIPFGLAHHRVPETGGSFPIASFNRLVQSPRVARERIGGARAIAEVASCLPFVMQETRQADRAMQAVALALETIPVHRLEFRRDDAFWSVVEER